MTMPDLTAAVTTANRRAAVLLLHFSRGSAEGFNAVVDEIENGEQMRDLVLALLALFRSVVPVLMTPAGCALVEQVVAGLAAVEVGDPE